MSQQANQPILADSPFSLSNNTAYQQWRSDRLCYMSPVLSDLLVQIVKDLLDCGLGGVLSAQLGDEG